MQRRKVFDSPRLLELKNRRRKNFQTKILFFILVIIIFFISIGYLSRIQRLKIKEISISGNKVIETDEIKKIADEHLAGNYLWVFPKNNLLFYPKQELTLDLKNNLKRISDVNLNIYEQRLEIGINERDPVATWCGESFDETSNISNETEPSERTEKCYFIDKDGYLFAEAPYFSSGVYVKYYGKINSTDEVVGSTFASNIFSRFLSLKNSLVNLELKPVIFYEKENGDTYIYLTSKTIGKLGPEIRIKNESNFEKVAENLEAALTTEPLKTEFNSKYSSLLYIDLRFGNKVYYKFQ